MTNQELADQLNEAFGLAGTDAITVNVLRQWVACGVLSKANPKGQSIGSAPLWERDKGSLEQADRLAELRKLGVRRKNALIAQSYLEWGHANFELVKEAILAEFIKWREQLNRRQTSFLAGEKFDAASNAKQRAIRNQLGPIDQLFSNTPLEQKPEFYALFAEASRNGEVGAAQMAAMLKDTFEQIDPQISEFVPQEILGAVISAMAGLTGYEDEISNSGECTIKKATRQQFENARERYARITTFSVPPEIQDFIGKLSANAQMVLELRERTHSQTSIGSWAILQFVQLLQLDANDPNLSQKIPGFQGIL